MNINKFFRKNKSVVYIAAVAVLVMLLFILQFGVRSPVNRATSFVINRGDSVSRVANRLTQKKLVVSNQTFKIAVRLNGGRVQSGEYDIPRGISAWGLARMFANGDVAATTVVIPEGLTIKQIKQLLLQSSGLTGTVECESGKKEPVCNLKDGQVFPDTYRVAKGTSRLALLDLARKKMVDIEENWKRAGQPKPRPLKNWNEVITLASIVQKETPQAEEMPIVASVYVNRLRKGMRLQADPTVVYALTDGLGDMQGTPLLRGHLKTESPYNTYMRSGLPPAPIANVGMAAIRAVLKPADTNYLFFVADGKGGHKFARDYEEHMQNHADWRKIKKIKNKN